MRRRHLLVTLLALASMPAFAGWRATTPAAEEAVKNPRIAGALEATARLDKAILEKDEVAFARMFAEDAVVNNPSNTVASKQDAVNNMRTGLIDYTSLERSIEHAATRGEHEVVLMGEETLTPVGKASFADKLVRRRTTEVWTKVSGDWQLSLRQATIYQAE
jgi:ketosteroid isomerase-like protein